MCYHKDERQPDVVRAGSPKVGGGRLRGEPEAVVTLEYVLEVDGEVVDASPGGEVLAVLWGRDHALPDGLVDTLVGSGAGPFEVSVPPEGAYGRHDPEKVATFGREDFPSGLEPEVGQEFYARDGTGAPVSARIVAVEGDRVTVDTNPEHAGKTIECRGVVHAVRGATPEEAEHGHAHGEGGVEH